LVIRHEILHALVHPQAGESSRSILGFWPSRLMFYAHFDGELSRNRFITILVTPTVVMTLLPLALAIAVQKAPGLVAWVSSMNVLFACGDFFGIWLLFAQVPSSAVCHNHGWRTYWKMPTAVPSYLTPDGN